MRHIWGQIEFRISKHVWSPFLPAVMATVVFFFHLPEKNIFKCENQQSGPLKGILEKSFLSLKASTLYEMSTLLIQKSIREDSEINVTSYE